MYAGCESRIVMLEKVLRNLFNDIFWQSHHSVKKDGTFLPDAFGTVKRGDANRLILQRLVAL